MSDALELVIITGMSGAGKTVAVQSFEDLGYYCIDNMPPSLLAPFWELMKESGKITRIALVIDLRAREFFDQLQTVIQEQAQSEQVSSRILFLEASEDTLVSRYKETRRDHPLAEGGRLVHGIRKEAQLLSGIREKADLIIDTSQLTPRQLRSIITDKFATATFEPFRIEVISFGFKYGLPKDADIAMDVRFLPNPYYVEDLRLLTGEDPAVYDYVMEQPETEEFYRRFWDLISYCLPAYAKEGKSNLIIGIGCTGGKHRSVSLARRLAKDLEELDYPVNLTHRDYHKQKESVKES